MNANDLPPEFERPSLLQGLRSLWLGSERFRCFVRGLPAVLAGIAVVLAACEARLTTETELLAHYSSEADRLVRAGNHEAALLCAERMALIRPSKPDYVYQQMLRLEAMGQPERALTLARKIAPDDRPGYAPAHFWIAHHLLQQDRRTPEVLRVAESHLRLYLRTFPESETEAHALLGLLYSATGRPVEAEVHLQQAVVRQPSLLLPLARACDRSGQAGGRPLLGSAGLRPLSRTVDQGLERSRGPPQGGRGIDVPGAVPGGGGPAQLGALPAQRPALPHRAGSALCDLVRRVEAEQRADRHPVRVAGAGPEA